MWTKRGTFTLVILAGLLAQSVMATSVNLRFEREGTSNSITLICRDTDTLATITDATFFLNGSPVEGDEDGELEFTITRETEGDYTCVNGASTHSNAVTIVAYPDRSPIPLPRPAFKLVEQSVQLSCPIAPGALIQHYRVRWFKSGQQIVGTNFAPTNPRYRINPDDLSLVIDDVQLSDTSNEYVCELTVSDPQTGVTRQYELLRNVNIRLVVLEHPRITRRPEPEIVREDESATFYCKATGSPLPYIIWNLRDNRIFANDEKFSIETEEEVNGTHYTRSSELTLDPAQPLDSGEISCVAEVPSNADTGEIELLPVKAATRLSVLGNFMDVEVRITVDRDVIFDLDLPTELEDPVRLYLEYRNADDSDDMDRKITSAMYTNLKNIRHIEFDSDVNFERFYVSVALQSAVSDVRGPIREAGRYDKSVPNTPIGELIRQTPVIVITSGCVFFLICCLIFLAYVINKVITCYRHKRLPEERRTDNELNKVIKKNRGPFAPKKGSDSGAVVEGILESACSLNEDTAPLSRGSSDGTAGGPPPPPTLSSTPTTTPISRVKRLVSRQKSRNDDLESGTLSGGSRAITKFVANSLYNGLTDKRHGPKFKRLVEQLMAEADRRNPQVSADGNHVTPQGQDQNPEPPTYLQSVSNPAYDPATVRSVSISVSEELDNKDAELETQPTA